MIEQQSTSWFSSRETKGVSIALLATLCYSLKPILIKIIYQSDVSSVSVLAWRMVFSLPIYLVIGYWLWRQHQLKVRRAAAQSNLSSAPPWVLKAMVLGVIGYYVAALLDLIGLQYISSQLARLILFTYPTLVALLAWLIYRQAISTKVFVALLVSYVGVAFIVVHDLDHLGSQVLFGSLMMFLSVLAFSFYVLMSKTVIDQVGGTAFTVVAMLASGVVVLIHLLLTHEVIQIFQLPAEVILQLFMMTIVTTVVPSFLVAEAIALIGPQKTSIAGTFGPAATSILAVLMLGEAFALPQLAGLVLVVLAITYMQR